MTSRFETFIFSINEIDLYWHRIANRVLRPYGLKGNYALYFTRLYSEPEGLTATRLGALCGKDKADVSRDVSALVSAGLVEKRQVGGSSYRARILLTEQGRHLAEQITEIVNTAVDCVGQELTEQERENFYRTLNTIARNMQKLSETGVPEDADRNL